MRQERKGNYSTGILIAAVVASLLVGYGASTAMMSGKVDSVKSDLGSTQQELSTVQDRVDTLEQENQEKQSQVQDLQQRVSELEVSRSAALRNSTTPADNLRVTLNSLLKEHVDLGLEVLRNAYNGRDSFAASEQRLDQNSQELAAAVGSVYGDQAESDFLALWRAHIGFFADHTTGLATDNETKVQQAVVDLNGYAADAGAFFSNANPNLPADAVEALAQEHGRLLRESMVAYDNGNYAEAYRIQREANTQVGKIADALATGIVKQFPDRFTS
jgi:cell division protein FtsL